MNEFKNELVHFGWAIVFHVKFFITYKKIIDSICNLFVNIEHMKKTKRRCYGRKTS